MCVAIPGQILAIEDAAANLALVEVAGVRRTINFTPITDSEGAVEDFVGVWVLVHVGFAIARLDEAEARRTIELLDEFGQFLETAEEEG